MNIVTLTMNPTIDLSAEVDRVKPDRKLRCGAPRHDPGGGGLNVSRAIHKLGGESIAYYASGGHAGKQLGDLLEEEGLRHRPLRISGHTRENVIVREQDQEQQYRFGFPGPDVSEEEIESCLERMREAEDLDLLVASGSLPPGVPDDFYARVDAIGKEKGAKVVVDTSGEPLRRAMEVGLYLVKPNRNELGAAVGRRIDSEEDQESAVRELLDRGAAEVIVLSLGAAGALLGADGGIHRLRAPTVRRKSAIGAGDSMVGGIALGLAREMPILEAVRFGLAAGSAAVRTPGTELCRRKDAELLYERMRNTDEH